MWCYAVVKFGGLPNNKHWLLGRETNDGRQDGLGGRKWTSKKTKKKKIEPSAMP